MAAWFQDSLQPALETLVEAVADKRAPVKPWIAVVLCARALRIEIFARGT